ncbi:sulfite exporter TauE/SafE family protein [Alkalicoccus luteus]|uniref:Ankyrin repeat domain-containing protein n=1 Tax=Alkalicoccus luteus TaxID=1237094 RepID=A0A969TU49_9BACI|nr:sulfite exporter TauE/SafE family protein [Alkalicoccus luteus]NJP38348.1 hypothetical protein [Alkalicoccus luteus]
MEWCRYIRDDKTVCTNAAGAATDHPGFGYCADHEWTEIAEADRAAFKQLLEEGDMTSLDAFLQRKDVHPDLSVGGFPTMLVYAVHAENAEAVYLLLKHGADRRIFRNRLRNEDIVTMVEQGRSDELLASTETGGKENSEFFRASASHREDQRVRTQVLRYALPGSLLLIASYVFGVVEETGVFFLLAGMIWTVVRLVKGLVQKRRFDYRLPVWMTMAGMLLTSAGTGFTGGWDVLFTAALVFFLGYLFLWLISVRRRSPEKRQRGWIVLVSVFLMIVSAGGI